MSTQARWPKQGQGGGPQVGEGQRPPEVPGAQPHSQLTHFSLLPGVSRALRTHTCTHTCARTRAHQRTYTRTCTHVHTRTHMHTHMHTRTHARAPPSLGSHRPDVPESSGRNATLQASPEFLVGFPVPGPPWLVDARTIFPLVSLRPRVRGSLISEGH